MTRDCLGRPINGGEENLPRRQILTDDEITSIANDVRTLPLSEVGRHVMPLIQHIVGCELRSCQTCRFWVTYDRTNEEAANGECTYVRCSDSKAKLQPMAKDQKKVEKIIDSGQLVLITPFDWQCKAWSKRQVDTDNPQASKE